MLVSFLIRAHFVFAIIEKVKFIAHVKEVIYQTLQEHNIEIPFPQQDVYIKELPNNGTEKK